MVPGKTVRIVPSTSIAFSELMNSFVVGGQLAGAQGAPAAEVYLSTSASVLAVATALTARAVFTRFRLVHG